MYLYSVEYSLTLILQSMLEDPSSQDYLAPWVTDLPRALCQVHCWPCITCWVFKFPFNSIDCITAIQKKPLTPRPPSKLPFSQSALLLLMAAPSLY